MITTIIKRDGREVPFELDKITDAIYKAAQATGGRDRSMAEKLANQVVVYIENDLKTYLNEIKKVDSDIDNDAKIVVVINVKDNNPLQSVYKNIENVNGIKSISIREDDE